MENNENKFADAADAAFSASKELVTASQNYFYAQHRALEAQIAYHELWKLAKEDDTYAFACKKAFEEYFNADGEKAEANTEYRIAKKAAKAAKAANDTNYKAAKKAAKNKKL